MRVPSLNNVNPVFKAYCKELAMGEGDEISSHDFILWAANRASEYRKLRCIEVGEFAIYTDEYVSWISMRKDAR